MKLNFNLWPGGVPRCLTMSYDDGQVFDVRLAEIFDKNGIKGTFHLNSDFEFDCGDHHLTRADTAAIASRHELSLHMHTHPFPTYLPREELIWEVEENRRRLECVAGYPLRGMSYPYGDYNEEVVKLLREMNVEYSRTTKATHAFGIPEDFLKWHPTCHHRELEDGTLWEKFMTDRYEWAHPLLFYVWGHSFEFDRNDNWQLIEDFCAKAGGRDDIWYATNIEIVDYVHAVKSLRMSADRTMIQNISNLDVYVSVDGEAVKLEAGKVTTLR